MAKKKAKQRLPVDEKLVRRMENISGKKPFRITGFGTTCIEAERSRIRAQILRHWKIAGRTEPLSVSWNNDDDYPRARVRVMGKGISGAWANTNYTPRGEEYFRREREAWQAAKDAQRRQEALERALRLMLPIQTEAQEIE